MKTRNLARFSRLCASARILTALVFILTGSIVALGQQITGSIAGTVKDQQGAVVNTATVKATNLDTGYSRSAPANGYGQYRIESVLFQGKTMPLAPPTLGEILIPQSTLAEQAGSTIDITVVLA